MKDMMTSKLSQIIGMMVRLAETILESQLESDLNMKQPSNLPLEDEPTPRTLPNRESTNYIIEHFNEHTEKWEFLLKTKKGRIAEDELYYPYSKRRMRVEKS